MTEQERIENARIQHQVESAIDDLPPLHEPPEKEPFFEPRPPTEQERHEFFKKYGVRMSRPSVPFSF